jgi:hypothetical protein
VYVVDDGKLAVVDKVANIEKTVHGDSKLTNHGDTSVKDDPYEAEKGVYIYI